jgi:hypothetical protein
MNLRVLNVLVIALVLALPPASAQTPAELLEKGIYAEETTGDLDAAIAIYRRILEAPDAQRGHAAQAQLHLGVCLLKSGKKAEACDAFEKVVQKFPESKDVVAAAKKRLADCAAQTDFVAAPWTDGEWMRLDLKLENGARVGAIVVHAEAAVAGGRNVWQLDVRRFVPAGGNNQGISRVTTDRASLLPISSSFHHTLLGRSDATYSEGKATVTTQGKDGPKVLEKEIPGGVLDNEEVFHAMRALPLAVGYRTKLSVLTPFNWVVLPIEVSVDKVETITVPAGTFECFRLGFSIGQTFWISTAPDRRIVRFDVQGVTAELSEFGKATPGVEKLFHADEMAFALTPPRGWEFLLDVLQADDGSATVSLLDPDVRTDSIAKVCRATPDEILGGIAPLAKKELDEIAAHVKGFKLREGSWTERKFGENAGACFAADYEQGDKQMTQYRVYILGAGLLAELTFRTETADFAQNRTAFDAIAESYRVETKQH